MTEKPPIDEGHAKVIEVMEPQASWATKAREGQDARREAGIGANQQDFVISTSVIVVVCSKSPSLRRRPRRLHLHKRTESGFHD